MRNGIHGPNAAFTQADYDVVRRAGARSVLLFRTIETKHTGAEVAVLRSCGVSHFTVRLPSSVWHHSNTGVQYVPSYYDYGEMCVGQIVWGAALGIYDYVLDNEANISWFPLGMNEWVYRAFMLDVIRYIRTRLIEIGNQGQLSNVHGVRLGCPPLAMATDPKYRSYDWGRVLSDVAKECDFLAAHSYWQSGRLEHNDILLGPLADERFGYSYRWLHQNLAVKPVVVAEWGNSIHEQGRFTPQQVEQFRLAQYPIWQEQAASQWYVESSYCFISPGATSDWNGFKITPAVATTLAR